MQSCGRLVLLAVVLLAVASQALPRGHRRRHHRLSGHVEGLDMEMQRFNQRNVQRRRRQSDSMTVEKAAKLGICPYEVSTDTNEKRYPKNITVVTCTKNSAVGDCKCEKMGLRRCTQLVSTMQVFYMDSGSTQDYQYNSGCICAYPEGHPAISTTPESEN